MNAKPRSLRGAVQRCNHAMPVFLASVCFVLISSFPLAVVALECASPTPTSSSLSVASCSVSTADLVIDVSQLGVGAAGSTRTVSVTNIDLAGRALIIAGWLASNPVDIARVDTHSMTISVTGVRGFGRLIVSGNFPNLTTFTVASTSIALNTSIAASVASATYGCSSATTISSAMCVVAPSLTYSLSVGSDVTLTNTWDPIVGHSTYSGSVAVASAITFVVGDVGISGTLAVTNSFLGAILSPSDVSLSAAGFWIQTTNNIIAGTVLLLNTSIHVAVSSAPGVLAQGVTWGGALWDVAADTLFIGGNGAWNITRCALDVQTSLVAATNAVGVYIRGVLSLYGTAQFMIDQTSVHVLTDHDEDSGVAEGVHFGFVRLTRGSMVTFMDSTWNVTSLVGNATMLYVPINGRFPSLFLLYRNTVYVNAPTANTTASFMITYGVMTMESQMLIHSNTIEVLTNATDSITIAPVGVRVSSMEATIDPVVTSQLLYGGTLDDGMFNISIGGSFSLVDSNFTFGDALLPIAVDGPLDIIFNLYPGCFMQLQGLRLTGGPGVVLLSRSFVKVFPTEVSGYSFTLGCLGVNDDYPANILSQYMYNDVLDVITAVPYCDCAISASALGIATTISGIYPNCVFTCQRASSNPISLLRERCAAPTFFSVSATITTKTMPPVQTATTYTDFISETKRSLTLSNSTTLPHTTSPIPSKSLSVPLTPTVKLTPSPTLIASPSRTKTLKPNTFSHSLSASREVSATKSRSLLPSQTHALNLTDSISMPLSVSHSHSQLQATISKELTRLTMFLSPSKGSQTPTDTLTFELNVTKTRYVHSRTLTFPVPPPPFNFLVQSQALGFLTLALTSISTILSSNPTVILTQFVAVMGQIYLTSDNAYQRTLPMAYILSPFWDYSKVVVAVANVLIILGVLAIHFLLSKFDVLGKIRGAPSVEAVPPDPPRVVVPSDDNDEEHDKKNQSTTSSERKPPSSVFAGPVVVQAEWVAAHFPELSFSLALVLYQGVVAAAFNIFYHESGASFVIGTMCLLFTIALPLVEYWILYGFLKVSMPPFTRVAYSSSASWWGRALPSGYWARCRAYASFGRIFNTMTDLGVKFTAYIFVVVLLVNAVAAVYASDQSERNGQYGVLGVLFLAGGLFVAIFRPHRSMVTNVVVITTFVLLMMLCVCLANESTNAGAADGVPALIVIIEVILWCNGMYDIAIWYSEERGALSRGREAFERGDRTELMIRPVVVTLGGEKESGQGKYREGGGGGSDDDDDSGRMMRPIGEEGTKQTAFVDVGSSLSPNFMHRDDVAAEDFLYSPIQQGSSGAAATNGLLDFNQSTSSSNGNNKPNPLMAANSGPSATVVAPTPLPPPTTTVAAPHTTLAASPPRNTDAADDDFMSGFLEAPSTSKPAVGRNAALQTAESSQPAPSLGDFGRPPVAPPMLDRGAPLASSAASGKKPPVAAKPHASVGVRPKAAPKVSKGGAKAKGGKTKPAGFSSSDDSDDSDL